MNNKRKQNWSPALRPPISEGNRKEKSQKGSQQDKPALLWEGAVVSKEALQSPAHLRQKREELPLKQRTSRKRFCVVPKITQYKNGQSHLLDY